MIASRCLVLALGYVIQLLDLLDRLSKLRFILNVIFSYFQWRENICNEYVSPIGPKNHAYFFVYIATHIKRNSLVSPTYVIGVANLPLQTHCYLLPLLCQCLPVYDEICGRTMNFVRSCLYHQSSVVKSVAWYSVLQGRYSSPIGRNVSLCLQRYKCTFNDFLSCHSFKNIICRFVSASCTDDSTLCVEIIWMS